MKKDEGQTMTKIEKTADEQPKDNLPDIVDDGDLPSIEQVSQDAADPGSSVKAEESDEKAQPEDPRAAIARKFRENRDRERAVAEGRDPEVETAPAEVEVKPEPETKAAAPVEQPADDDREITLKIDGREVKKTLSEVKALAQQTVAGDNRLEETKRLLREAQALRASPTPEHKPDDGEEITRQHDQTPKDKTAREHQPKQALDPDKLKGIVERIQVGDSDEGMQALQELVDMTRGGADLSPEKIGTMVKHHLQETQATDEINSALASFVKEFPDLAKDELLADAGRTALRQELIKDLKSIGADEADIDKIKHDPRALATAQRQLRAAGHKVRSYGEILGAVGKTMTDKFGLKPASVQQEVPSPKSLPPAREPAPSQERLNRKLAAPQQPRAAGVRGQLQQAPQPKSKRDVVSGMRAARGFPNH
jgi:hypothetical protein